MADEIAKTIAVINPDSYHDYKIPGDLAKFKRLIKSDPEEAFDQAKPKAVQEHKLIYDSTSESLEQVYFWILDFMGGQFKLEKLIDNFTSTPGGSSFSEAMAKATRMQEEGMKIMQTVGILIKSLINIIYDLRQFEIRFNDYDASRSNDKNKAEAGLIALKQIWLDNVDIKRGTTSIKSLTFSQTSFATLIDAFMIAKNESDIKKMDLNDRVKRILLQRILEFNKWKDLSEKELRKRYQVQRSWLKSQVNALQLYSRWAKPYLKAAEELSMTESKDVALIKSFNTTRMQLSILGKEKIDVEDEATNKNFPYEFRKVKLKRDYYVCVLVDFIFRGFPQRPGQYYLGRTEVTFRAYCLNEDEISLLQEKLKESDLSDALRLVEGATEESLNEMKEDIDYFLKEEHERKLEIEGKAAEEDINPFSALLGIRKTEKVSKKIKTKDAEKAKIEQLKEQGVKKDSYTESVIRKLCEQNAAEACFRVFDIYKKAHGMESHPSPEWDEMF